MAKRLPFTKACLVHTLGSVDYPKALLIQERLLDLRKCGAISDVLLLLQHPSVLTIGRSGVDKNIIIPTETLIEEGIPVFYTNRGGDVTYHGPGQVVGYPILHLIENDLTVHQYVWNLEEIVIRTLVDFGIGGQRVSGFRGVWIGGEKICALGVRVSSRVTMHGFALNVNTNLKYFTYIVPCGILGSSVTSVSKLLGHEVEIEEIQESLLRHFSQIFRFTLEYGENFDRWLASLSPSGSEEELLTGPR
jgi:lipoate-protein ligase B